MLGFGVLTRVRLADARVLNGLHAAFHKNGRRRKRFYPDR
jgi:hypothetical protein